ncbi:MAG: hypothetical protein U0893_05695 [Chloroflexota bacterium]
MPTADRPPHLISPDAVADWLAGSAVLAVTYHRTSRESAERIRRTGVVPARSRVGTFGAGFYTASVEEEEYGPATLVVAIRLVSPLSGDLDDVEAIIDRIAARLNPPRGEITEAVAQAIRLELLNLGYDGIIVRDGGGDGVDWVVALTGASVKVVDE